VLIGEVQDDLSCVVEFLNDQTAVSKIIIFGRSMGAVTALLYSSKRRKDMQRRAGYGMKSTEHSSGNM